MVRRRERDFRSKPRTQWTDSLEDQLIDIVESDRIQSMFVEATTSGRPVEDVWAQVPGLLGILVSPRACQSKYEKIKSIRLRALGEQVEEGEVVIHNSAPILQKLDEVNRSTLEVYTDTQIELISEIRESRQAVVAALENLQAAMEMMNDQFASLVSGAKKTSQKS